jgi:hypothetical protein
MQYFKSAMFIPGKGQAWTYSEASDEDRVQRSLTHIPATGEISRIPDPVVKMLFMKERLSACPAEEFLTLWNRPAAD